MERDKTVKASAIFLVRPKEVCLAQKKAGIGAGCLMPYGGHQEGEESLEECACRELLEEARVKTWPTDLTKVAILRCHNLSESGQRSICVVYVFITDFWLSDPKEGKEMGLPEWFLPNHLPYLRLMMADQDWLFEWLPRLINEKKKIVVTIWHGPNQATLEKPVLAQDVDELPNE